MQAGDRFCPNCGAATMAGGLQPAAEVNSGPSLSAMAMPKIPTQSPPAGQEAGSAGSGMASAVAGSDSALLGAGDTELTLKLDRPTGVYAPGETIRASLKIVNHKDLNIRQGRMELLMVEEFEYRSREYSPVSKTWESRTSWDKAKQIAGHWEFLGAMTLPAGFSRIFEHDFFIPQTAIPTAQGHITSCKWILAATLDRKLAFDRKAENEITVLSLAPGAAASPGDFGTSNHPDQAKMSLSLRSREFVTGEKIAGNLQINPQKDFEVTEVRLELIRFESVPRDEGNRSSSTKEVQLADKTNLQAGKALSFAFQIVLPAGGPVTMNTGNSSISWGLRGVLARPWHRDPIVEEAIFIYSGR